jgi:type II secretory pathway component GspD/PulD (secretin)
VVSSSTNQGESNAVGGLQVHILPLIGKDDVVQLSITANLDDLTGWSPEGSPIFENRSTQSKVTLKDGETFLLSGLQKTTAVDSESGIPILRSILPFVFSKKTKTKMQNEVWILLTPHIQRAPTAAPANAMKQLEAVDK